MTAAAPARLDLSSLLAPLDMAQFLAEYWQQKPFVTQFSAPVFEEILARIGPLEIPRIAGLASEGCQAWLSNRYVAHSVFACDAANAAEFFEAGATLYFLNIQAPGLTGAIADELGVPRHRVVASLFLTAPGNGAAAHFDKNENFTVQLTGAKCWTAGERPALRYAPESHIWGRELAGDLTALQAEVGNPPRREIALTPGSLLYIPRGTVHATQAKEASWSLNISYTGFMWVDLFCDGLRRELLKVPHWRESVIGVGPDASTEARRRNRIASLTHELRDLLQPGLLADMQGASHERQQPDRH